MVNDTFWNQLLSDAPIKAIIDFPHAKIEVTVGVLEANRCGRMIFINENVFDWGISWKI